MKQLVLVIIFLVFAPKNSFSQKTYVFPENFSPIYDFKPDQSYKQLLNSPEAKEDRDKFEKYIVSYIYNTQYEFDANYMYMNWNEAENYMIKLLDTILSKRNLNKKLDIFINRNISVNAYTNRYGMVFCNIGLIAKSENEAFLTEVIAHEAAHYLFKHHIKGINLSEELFKYTNTVRPDDGVAFLKETQKNEMQADTFALHCAKDLNCNLIPMASYFEMMDAKQRMYRYSTSFKKMVRVSQMSKETFRSKKNGSYRAYSSHPSSLARLEIVNKEAESCKSCTKNYFLDSGLFNNLKKMAREECKKITFEENDFDECIRYCFIDYLYNPKNIKNLYYLSESIRRLLYSNTTLTKKGFLTQYIDDDELFYSNQSILYKPDFIFSSFKEYDDLNNHSFFTQEKKPFNTYREAFEFFTKELLKSGINEANFSRALYFYAQKNDDSCKKYLNTYLTNNGGINTNFAQSLISNLRPTINKGKSLIIYRSSDYTGYSFNYYLTKNKIIDKESIKQSLIKDTSKTELVFTNELYGKAPNLLYQYQKLERAITSLYDEDDIDHFKKQRLNSTETVEEVSWSNKYNKHLLIFAPEYFNWLTDKKISTVFYADIVYQSEKWMEQKDFANNYIGYYLDINALRPYFKDPVRNGFTRRQSEKDILHDLNNFLYGYE